jgi:hypothetical protein
MGVGVHADIGGQRNYKCQRFAADLRAEKEQLESLEVTVRHVSGICSHCNGVTATARPPSPARRPTPTWVTTLSSCA